MKSDKSKAKPKRRPVPAKGQDDGQSVIAVIKGIRSGGVNPKRIDQDLRRRCTEYLSLEGYSVPEMAGILGISDRTVSRDRDAIRRTNALKPDAGFVEQMVGRLVQEADVAITRTRRAVRGKDATVADKLTAEKNCWQIVSELVENLRRVGYLPSAAVEFRGDVTHRVGLPATGDILAEIERVKAIGLETGSKNPEVLDALAVVTQDVEKLAVVEKTKALVERIETEKDSREVGSNE